ncbi:MAG: hypothetical protein J7J57_03270 [Caldisericaceae bacterium]|nr:hypothetical protein [Caldisericaceae bacterium]
MQDEIKKVLEMLDEGRVSKDEAAKLIEALKEVKDDEQSIPQSKRKRVLKILVKKEGKPQVHITIPFKLVNWGLNIANKMGKKNMLNVGGEDVPIDMEELQKAMNDSEFYGKVVDITDEEEGKHVEIEIV